MRSNRLGCLTGTGLLTALFTAFVIAGYAYARGGLMYNPGPLNEEPGEMLGGVTSHAETGGDCSACHTAPWEPAEMADRCVNCHGDIAVQMRDVASMHGSMLHDNPDLGCRHCHPEHRG
ncbi:MAG TPA: cytochrome c3 family protein, partial [Anaerolineales bacterium]|nr:cytochrome c3 family protein [Anaerolineales bacterium]